MKRTLSAAVVICALLAPLDSPQAKAVKNRALKDLDGKSKKLWKKNATVAVLLFFKAKHKYTEHAFKEIARCRGDIGKRPVTFVGIVQSAERKAEIKKMLARIKVTIPVLVDTGRKLATELGIRAFPSFALINVMRSTITKQPIMRIGLCEALAAKVKFALGELNEREMEEARSGGKGITKTANRAALRYQKIATMLRMQKRFADAKKAIDVSIKRDPKCAHSYAVLGSILVDLKKCKAASAAFAKALKLDSKDSLALAGKKRPCGK